MERLENSKYYIENGIIYNSRMRKAKLWSDKDGYYRVSLLMNDGSRLFIGVHKVILFHFLNLSLAENLIAHHINNNKKDNRIENLKLVDVRENTNLYYNRVVRAEFESGGYTYFKSIEEASKVLRACKKSLINGKFLGGKCYFEKNRGQNFLCNNRDILNYLNTFKKIYFCDGHIFYSTYEIDDYFNIGRGSSKYYIKKYGAVQGKRVI